ncbi:MAG: histone deacetylase [Candidatus Thorarchaeota archaeon]|nr:histone deacetylase [Candidatus Thorarchaeota archaeon]
MSRDTITLIEQSGCDQHVAPFTKPHMEGFENPDRITMTLQYLEENNALDGILKFKTPIANCEEALLVHSPYLVHSVEIMSELGSGQLGESAYASENLLSTALHALGGAMFAAELAASDSCRHSFALVRPPGHHATTSSSMGLCFFNNVAVATRKLLKDEEVKKVTILDIDDHFGNGTAEIFYDDPSVQFISIHEYNHDSFGLGHFRELGQGEAKGTNINVPLYEESPDASYQTAFTKVVKPAIESFNPDIIAVSAGYDAHFTDPIGDLNIDSRTYWFIANEIERLVSSLSMKGSFWVLEGGYNPLVLGPCVQATLDGLQKRPLPQLADQEERDDDDTILRANTNVINKIVKTVSPFL